MIIEKLKCTPAKPACALRSIINKIHELVNRVNTQSEEIKELDLVNVTISGPSCAAYNAVGNPAEKVVSNITPVQTGSGEPSPNNVRLISGRTRATIKNDATGQTISSDFPEPVYSGMINWTSGELVSNGHKIVIDGVNIVVKAVNQSLYGAYAITHSGHPAPKAGGVVACSHFPINPNVALEGTCHVSQSNAGTVYIGVVPGINNAEEYNAWLASNPISCVYQVESPTAHQLTPAQVDMAPGSNTVWSDSGNTELTYTTHYRDYVYQEIEALKNAILAQGANI